MNALRDIRYYQKNSDALIIPRNRMAMIIKDTIKDVSGKEDIRVSLEACAALQTAAETMAINYFEILYFLNVYFHCLLMVVTIALFSISE